MTRWNGNHINVLTFLEVFIITDKYKISKLPCFSACLELVDLDGYVFDTIHVQCNLLESAAKIMQCSELLSYSHNILKTFSSASSLDDFNSAVHAIFAAVFSEDDIVKIMYFFNHSYFEAALQVLPFISANIIPEIKKISSAKKRSTANSFRMNFLQRIQLLFH